MSKLDRLIRDGGAAAAESMGAGVPAVHNAPRPGPAPVSAQLDGVTRVKNVASIPVGKTGKPIPAWTPPRIAEPCPYECSSPGPPI